jgi:hypothetical protein
MVAELDRDIRRLVRNDATLQRISPLKVWGMRLAQRINIQKKARIAVARVSCCRADCARMNNRKLADA